MRMLQQEVNDIPVALGHCSHQWGLLPFVVRCNATRRRGWDVASSWRTASTSLRPMAACRDAVLGTPMLCRTTTQPHPFPFLPPQGVWCGRAGMVAETERGTAVVPMRMPTLA